MARFMVADKANEDLADVKLVRYLSERVNLAVDITDEVFILISDQEIILHLLQLPS